MAVPAHWRLLSFHTVADPRYRCAFCYAIFFHSEGHNCAQDSPEERRRRMFIASGSQKQQQEAAR